MTLNQWIELQKKKGAVSFGATVFETGFIKIVAYDENSHWVGETMFNATTVILGS